MSLKEEEEEEEEEGDAYDGGWADLWSKIKSRPVVAIVEILLDAQRELLTVST